MGSGLAPAGSIPACAGEPLSHRLLPAGERVYPRVCGGTRVSRASVPIVSGLSPRVRGNRPRGRRAARLHGSIPACAGEPAAGDVVLIHGRVYPRVCGGTDVCPRVQTADEGLSPRVRGNRIADRELPGRAGSIPACAGEPPGPCGPGRTRRVYPRVCGGTPATSANPMMYTGLSPRVRGNRERPGGAHHRTGSIPACAGEPAYPPTCLRHARVYPRVCGGTAMTISAECRVTGLSPRVRGNLRRGHPCRNPGGSIPACAGEPARQGPGA